MNLPHLPGKLPQEAVWELAPLAPPLKGQVVGQVAGEQFRGRALPAPSPGTPHPRRTRPTLAGDTRNRDVDRPGGGHAPRTWEVRRGPGGPRNALARNTAPSCSREVAFCGPFGSEDGLTPGRGEIGPLARRLGARDEVGLGGMRGEIGTSERILGVVGDER